MALEKRRELRRASVAVTLTAFLFIYLGSASFLNRFVSDPFIAAAPSVASKTASPDPLAEVSVPFEVSSLRVSPEGRYIAVGAQDGKEQTTTIHAGRVGGSLMLFSADDAAFADERRLLLLERLPGISRLRLVDLARGPDDLWTLSVPVQRARLSLDRASQRWSLLGWGASGDIASATGLVGQDTVANLGWKRPEPEDVRVALVSASSSEVLALESTIKPGRFGTRRRAVSVLWSISDHGSSSWATTRLELQCSPLSTRGELALCLAFDGGTTRFFEVNPVTRRLKALVSVSGRFLRSGDEGSSGWIAGSSNLGSVLLRTTARRAVAIDARDGSHADGLAIGDRVVGAVFSHEDGSTVRLYDREQIGIK